MRFVFRLLLYLIYLNRNIFCEIKKLAFFAQNWHFRRPVRLKKFLEERQNFVCVFLIGRINHSERASFLARKSVILRHPISHVIYQQNYSNIALNHRQVDIFIINYINQRTLNQSVVIGKTLNGTFS